MKPASAADLIAWMDGQPDLSPLSVLMALQFINARRQSIASMVRVERIDDPHPTVFPPTFRFRWRRCSIVFDRAPIHSIGNGFWRDEANIHQHCEDSDDSESYGFDAIDARFLEYFDEMQEREKWTDT
jgi:hypothetical protein